MSFDSYFLYKLVYLNSNLHPLFLSNVPQYAGHSCVAILVGWPVLLKCFIELAGLSVRVTQWRVISITMDTSISIILPVEGQGD